MVELPDETDTPIDPSHTLADVIAWVVKRLEALETAMLKYGIPVEITL